MTAAHVLPPEALYPARHLEISQRFVELRTGITVRVAERGPSDGAPVLMLPGWATPLFMFRHAFDMLPSRAFRVIGTELRGFGLSSKPRTRGAYGVEEYCADLDALLDALALPRVALLGQSMGGGVALHYALRHPERVRALALVNPTGLVKMPLVGALGLLPPAVPGALGKHLVPRALVSFVLRHLAHGDATQATDEAIDEYWSPTQLEGFAYAAQAAVSEFDWAPLSDGEAARLAAPALVMIGSSDRLVHNTARSAGRLANADVCLFEGGHCVHEERPAEAYRAIGDWLTEHGR